MKKIVVYVLIAMMVLGGVLQTSVAFTASELDDNALDIFLSKLAGTSQGNRELAAETLNNYISDGDKGIDQLVKATDGLIMFYYGEDGEEKLKKYGYTVSDLKSEINRLKSWSTEDRELLVKYIKQGKATKLSSLIYSNEGEESDTGAGGAVEGTEEVASKLLDITFTDIGEHWAKKEVVFMAERGFVEGYEDNEFKFEQQITREEFAAYLTKTFKLSLGEEAVENPFTDINEEYRYYNDIMSAFKNGLINGRGDGIFAPKDFITREEMAAVVIRGLDVKGIGPKLSKLMMDSELMVYSDRSEISPWALDYCAKTIKLEVIKGQKFDVFAPQSNATRAEATTILYRIYKLLNK